MFGRFMYSLQRRSTGLARGVHTKQLWPDGDRRWVTLTSPHTNSARGERSYTLPRVPIATRNFFAKENISDIVPLMRDINMSITIGVYFGQAGRCHILTSTVLVHSARLMNARRATTDRCSEHL